jgi:hypothetical protein
MQPVANHKRERQHTLLLTLSKTKAHAHLEEQLAAPVLFPCL